MATAGPDYIEKRLYVKIVKKKVAKWKIVTEVDQIKLVPKGCSHFKDDAESWLE